MQPLNVNETDHAHSGVITAFGSEQHMQQLAARLTRNLRHRRTQQMRLVDPAAALALWRARAREVGRSRQVG